MKNRHILTGLLVIGLTGFLSIRGDVTVENSRVQVHPTAGLRIMQGDLPLPAAGLWQLLDQLPDTGLIRQLSLLPPTGLERSRIGERGKQIERDRQLRSARYAMSSFWWPLMKYARKHEGQLPGTFNELELETNTHLQNLIANSVYPERAGLPPAPHYALLKDVKLVFPDDRELKHASPTNREPMMVELHPLLPDGKHYVLFTNGSVRRLAIDTDKMAASSLTVTPSADALPDDAKLPEIVKYTVYGLNTEEGIASFTVKNRMTGEQRVCSWDTHKAAPGTPEQIKTWALSSSSSWPWLSRKYDAPILTNWVWLQEQLFGTKYPVSQTQSEATAAGSQQYDQHV